MARASPSSTTAPLYAALCAVGQLRAVDTATAPHWAAQARFARSLMMGTDWAGLHLVLVTDALERELDRTRRIISASWGLPSDNFHAFRHGVSPRSILRSRCTNLSQYEAADDSTSDGLAANVGGDAAAGGRFCAGPMCRRSLRAALHAFYGQWTKAKACSDRVLSIEKRRQQRFRFVVKTRTDWPFVAATPLTVLDSLAHQAVVYARFRCANTAPRLLPDPYLAQNRADVSSLGSGCARSAVYMDDQLVVAPRRTAKLLFSAADLPCPTNSAEVQRRVTSICMAGNERDFTPMAECLLHVHVTRMVVRNGVWCNGRRCRGHSLVGPILASWAGEEANASRDSSSSSSTASGTAKRAFGVW